MTEILIDQKQVKHLKELFKDGFDDFVSLYFSDFETKDKELIEAIETNKLETARKIAHALKGNSLNVGAMSLADVCKNVEFASKNLDSQEAELAYQDLKKIYPSVKSAYIHLVSTL